MRQTPGRTAFVRFRKALVMRGLDTLLFVEITSQFKAKAIRVKTGTLVDASIIASASEMMVMLAGSNIKANQPCCPHPLGRPERP